jgi:cell division protein FtsI/penicillin-binding protein 2
MGNSNDHQKHEAAKRRQFSFRLNIFFFSVFLLFSILIVRLAILQFVDGTELQAHKFENSTSTMEIPPIRGNINDRNGYPIAYSTSTQSLYYRVESNHKKDDVIEMAQHLSKTFDEYADDGKAKLTPEEIVLTMDLSFDFHKNERVIKNYNHIPRRIKTDLSKSEIAYILEHRDEFKGLEIIEESVRHYAEDQVAVQLVGYLRQYSTARNQSQSHLDFYRNREVTSSYLDVESVGFDGLEFMYQEQLRGINGSKSYPVNALGQIVGNATITYPTKGNNLYLTIDKDVQMKSEQAIENHLNFMKSEEAGKTYAMGEQATTGYAVAMEVNTGKIMAMASFPDYDSNIWTGGVSQKIYNENEYYIKNGTISESYPNYEEYAERAKHPTSLVPLGSTMKPLTILLGLKEGLVTPQSTYNDPGFFDFGKDNNARIRNSKSTAMGKINAFEALRRSSNVYMSAMIGNPLYRIHGNKGVDVWDEYMESFGLGVLTGSGLPGEIKGTKEYMDYSSSSAQAALVFASWGQQGRYTALQLAQYTTMLANKGKRLKPQFVDKITTADGETVEEFEPVILNEEIYADSEWELVHGAMKLVSKQGFEGFPHTVASKTGTSQQQVAGSMIENAVYIAFAPADNPTLAVAVIVPEGGYGAWGAAPIARQIFDAYDEAFGLAKEE